jgi:hypothetical protein
MLNKDSGQEPGARAVYAALQSCLYDPGSPRKETEDLLSRLRVAEAFGILASATPLTAERRVAFLRAGPKDVTEGIGAKGAQEFLRQVFLDAPGAAKRVDVILEKMKEFEPKIRTELYTLLKSSTPTQVALAATALGEIGQDEDAAKLAPFLTHPQGIVREAAAVALARCGKEGLNQLGELFAATPNARRLVMAALPHANLKDTRNLLIKGLRDPDSQVRLHALSVFGALPPVLTAERPKLIKEAKKILRDEIDPSVRVALALLK